MKSLVLALLLLPALVSAECYLTWDAPTEDIEGMSLVAGDVDAYRVYVLPRGQAFVKGQYVIEILPVSDDVDPPSSVRCFGIEFSGSKKARVTAVGTGGESDWSNEVVIKIPGAPSRVRKEERDG